MRFKIFKESINFSLNNKNLEEAFMQCINFCKQAGYNLPFDIDVQYISSNEDYGIMTIENGKFLISLNSVLTENNDTCKSIILHELAHYMDAYFCIKSGKIKIYKNGKMFIPQDIKNNTHGENWRNIVKNLSEVSGLEIEEEPSYLLQDINQEKYIESLPYIFKCENCGHVEGTKEKDLSFILLKSGLVNCCKCNGKMIYIKGS